MILFLLACGDPPDIVKDRGDTAGGDTSSDSSLDSDSADSGDASGETADSVDTSGDTDDSSSDDPWDTAPVYPCPEPAGDAIVIDALAYIGDSTTTDTPDGFRGMWVSTRSVNYAADRCYTNDSIYGPLFAGEPDTWGVDFELASSLDFPIDEQGLHLWEDNFAGDPSNYFSYWGRFFHVDDGVEREWYFLPDYRNTGTADLCLSEVRPDHLSGVLLYTSDPDNPYGALSFYFRFTFVGEDPSDMAEFDDGTCFYYEYVGVEESEVWTAGYGDTGA